MADQGNNISTIFFIKIFHVVLTIVLMVNNEEQNILMCCLHFHRIVSLLADHCEREPSKQEE